MLHRCASPQRPHHTCQHLLPPARPRAWQAAVLSWFVYAATLFLILATVALVLVKFNVDASSALFKHQAW